MDGALRQAIAELARDDAFARAVVELSSEDRAVLVARLRAMLVEDKGGHRRVQGPQDPDRPVAVRCGDRGCTGLVADAVGAVVGFVSLEKSAGCGSTNEMTIVERSVELGDGVQSAATTPAYCPRCWLRCDIDAVLQEVRVARLLGHSRRVMAGSATAKGN